MLNSVSFTIEGDINTQVTISKVLVNGQVVLQFSVEVLDTSGSIGDLRALYFDLGFDVDANSLIIADDFNDITETAVAEGDVSSLGQDTNLSGKAIKTAGEFDVGIEFGTMGIGEDDIRSTSFTLALADGSDFTLDALDSSDFGLRYTSVGEEDGSRNDSSKIVEVGAVSVARDDEGTTLEDETLTGNVLLNDSIVGTISSFLVDGTVYSAGQTAVFFEGSLTFSACMTSALLGPNRANC